MCENDLLKDYRIYLKLERALSPNSVEAYLRDTQQMLAYLQSVDIPYNTATLDDLRRFVTALAETGLQATSQARKVSSIKSFYNYLLYSHVTQTDPSVLLEQPTLPKHLPEVLSIEEIERIEAAIDLSRPDGHRNLAIIETLYGSGLRVSELINLKCSNMRLNQQYMSVEGKGSKQRLVPLSERSINCIKNWMTERNMLQIKPKQEDFLFLNRRGSRLTRIMIFHIVKQLTAAAGIEKTVSPHTFRHSFATHLLEGGANLRAIQQMLGHESILTTEIYTHMDVEFLRSEILNKHPRNAPSIQHAEERATNPEKEEKA